MACGQVDGSLRGHATKARRSLASRACRRVATCVMDGDGNAVGTEDFRCAPGPAGWRYFSEISTREPSPHQEIVDLVVDRSWNPVRVKIATGSHDLLLTAEGDALRGSLDGDVVTAPWGPAWHVDYLSPAFNAVTANRLDGTTEIDVIYLEPVMCTPTEERQRYELIGDEEVTTPVGRFGGGDGATRRYPGDGAASYGWPATWSCATRGCSSSRSTRRGPVVRARPREVKPSARNSVKPAPSTSRARASPNPYCWRLSSVSISSLTLLPTSKPPVSTATFHVMSQSSRSTSVLAENAARDG